MYCILLGFMASRCQGTTIYTKHSPMDKPLWAIIIMDVADRFAEPYQRSFKYESDVKDRSRR